MAWAAGGAGLVALAGFAAWVSHRFSYDHAVVDMPVLAMVAVLCGAGLIFAVGLPWLVRRTAGDPGMAASTRHFFLVVMIAAGLAARLLLLPSEPMLEDDYQRYLWDGAVTAAGLNPYGASPKQAARAPLGSKLRSLAGDGSVIVQRIGHANLKTIYPPVAQGAFALAHVIGPWSLVAWKGVLLVGDLTVLGLILVLLREIGRAPLWAALYWWNPLVIKELFNSGHMEAIVMAPVLLALVLAIRRRPLAAVVALGVAAGAKVWPALLLPLLLRPLLNDPRKLAAAAGAFMAMMGLWVWPVLVGGLDDTSGFVAYAGSWQTNSAFFPALQKLLGSAAATLGLSPEWGNWTLRAALASGTGALAVWLAWRPIGDASDLVRRAAIVTAALVLLSPAQYPWYAIWFLPFLPFVPLRGFLVLTATLPLYYLFFHFNAREHAEVFRVWVVWMIWIPAWLALIIDVRGGAFAETSARERTT